MHHPVKPSPMLSASSRGGTSTLVTSRLRLLALSVAVSAALGVTVVMAQTDDYAEVNRLMRAGQLSEALSKVDQYLTSKPRDPQMRFLKGVIQTEGGKHSDAIATFSKLTEEFPELPEPYNNLAVLYAGQSQFDKARAALEAFGSERNPARWGELNWQLHSALYGDAQRPVLLAEIRSLYDKVERFVRALLAVTPELPKTQREHHIIIDAFAARDAERAATLTRAHVLDGGASLVKYLSEHRAEPRTSPV